MRARVEGLKSVWECLWVQVHHGWGVKKFPCMVSFSCGWDTMGKNQHECRRNFMGIRKPRNCVAKPFWKSRIYLLFLFFFTHSHRSSCFLVICFGHNASWLDLLTATENKPLLHFSCVTSLTNKLLSTFYTDSCKWPGPFHAECFLQAEVLKRWNITDRQQWGPLSWQRVFLAARFY